MGTWEALDHTADLALRVTGNDLPDLFVTAARGLFAFLTAGETAAAESATPLTESATITLTSFDLETLLVDWLNELLYLAGGEPLKVYSEFTITELTPITLQATARGEPVAQHAACVKAATFHNLAVRQTAAGFETEIVFDT